MSGSIWNTHLAEAAAWHDLHNVVVKEGDAESLSEMEDDELDRVEQAADYQLHSRLGCQAVVKGDVTVNIPEWNRRNYVSEGH